MNSKALQLWDLLASSTRGWEEAVRGREEAIGLQEFPAMEIVLEWHRDVRGAQTMEPSLAKKGGKKGIFLSWEETIQVRGK